MAYGRETLELLVRVAEEYDLLIAADEIYTAYFYEGAFRPIRTLPGAAERTLTLNSFSKDYLMTGWRVGSIIAAPDLVRAVNRINGALVYSAPSVSQRAAIAALAMRESIRREYAARYRKRVFRAADRIERIPYLDLCRPRGSFYLFPGIKRTGLSSARFCAELLEKAHVLVSAGDMFGRTGEGHFRIACTVDDARMEEAFDRMEKLTF